MEAIMIIAEVRDEERRQIPKDEAHHYTKKQGQRTSWSSSIIG
jgi:hypothetical protein